MKPSPKVLWVPGIFSFTVVGLGQIVKGDSHKGLKFLLIFYFALPASLLILLNISGTLFLIAFGFSLIFSIILWIYNIWDAVNYNLEKL